MGVAGLVFEPPPPNFEKIHNFPRNTNDIIMKYGYFHWFKSLKKSLGVSFTDILVLLGLVYYQVRNLESNKIMKKWESITLKKSKPIRNRKYQEIVS